MMRFLRRRDCGGQDRSATIEGVAETFVALNRGPRVQAMEIWLSWPPRLRRESKGAKMKDRLGRWHISQFAGRRTCLAGILMAGWDKEAPMGADWTKRGCGHRGGVVRSC